MKTFYNRPILLSIFFLSLVICGCKKFLDEKPSASLAVPSTIKDLQSLLDTYYVMNETDPSADEVSAAEFYVTDVDFLAREVSDQQMYTWQNDNVLPAQLNDWYYLYTHIYRANTVLENIDHIAVNTLNAESWRNLKGQALYYRAKAYLQGVNIWGKPYHSATAATDLGIPIRANTNFNEQTIRASVKQNYDLLITDLKASIPLLPIKPTHVVRPSRPAAYGMLSRVYLWMGDYDQALKYADSCLALKNDLLDFNSLTATATYPIAQYGIEVIHSSRMANLSIFSPSRAKVIPEVYASYDVKDLRKTVYFKDNLNGTYSFKGSYDGSTVYFSGVASDEIYLTRAECLARAGKVAEALKDLNTLLKKRYKTGLYVDYNLTESDLVLQLILKERRKELLYRGLRWADIKRLNKEGANINLSRTINGKTYNLLANSLRFAIPIPDDVIAISGIPQNKY